MGDRNTRSHSADRGASIERMEPMRPESEATSQLRGLGQEGHCSFEEAALRCYILCFPLRSEYSWFQSRSRGKRGPNTQEACNNIAKTQRHHSLNVYNIAQQMETQLPYATCMDCRRRLITHQNCLFWAARC